MTPTLLDPAWIRAALTGLLSAGTLRDLRILGTAQRALAGLLVARTPGIAIVPASSAVAGPQGVGNGRLLTESFELVIQVSHLAGDDAGATADLRTIRTAVLAALEGQRPAADWSPLRYQGGQLLAIDDAIYTWVERYSTQIGLPTL